MCKKILNFKLWFFSFIFLLLSVKSVDAADFYFSKIDKVEVNSRFSLSVVLNTQKENVNTFETKINFDPQFLEVSSIDVNSIFTFFPQKDFDNKNGLVHVIGASPSPGFNGEEKIFTINFHALQTGETEVGFADGNKILKDKNSSNIFESAKNTNLQIVEKTEQKVKSDTSKKSTPFASKPNMYLNLILIVVITNLITLFVALLFNLFYIQRKTGTV